MASSVSAPALASAQGNEDEGQVCEHPGCREKASQCCDVIIRLRKRGCWKALCRNHTYGGLCSECHAHYRTSANLKAAERKKNKCLREAGSPALPTKPPKTKPAPRGSREAPPDYTPMSEMSKSSYYTPMSEMSKSSCSSAGQPAEPPPAKEKAAVTDEAATEQDFKSSCFSAEPPPTKLALGEEPKEKVRQSKPPTGGAPPRKKLRSPTKPPPLKGESKKSFRDCISCFSAEQPTGPPPTKENSQPSLLALGARPQSRLFDKSKIKEPPFRRHGV